MKLLLKILFTILYIQAFGQNNNPDYSNDIPYGNNIAVTFYAYNENSDLDVLISLLGENIALNNNDENQFQIRTNKKKHRLLIEILKKYNPSNEIYYFDPDENVEFPYETNTKRKIKSVSNAVLVFEIYYLSICSDTSSIYIFDLNTSIKILNELSEIYKNKEKFRKLIEIINRNYSNAEIQGVVHSSTNNKLVTKKVYIHETKTNQTVKANENGEFTIKNLKRNENYTLRINAYDYKKTEFQVETNKRVIKELFDLKGNCEFSKKPAKRDWNNGTPKLLLKTGGISGNFTNRSVNNDFELKYNIEYVSFGCMPPNEKCIKEYNKKIFKLLDKKYGKLWRKETRYDVANLNKKDVEILINEIKR